MPYPKRDSSYAFIYDGTLEGLLCAIFETYRQKLVPSEIVTEENLQLRLGQQPITIPTSPAIAQRVKDGLCRDCGRSTFSAIGVAFLSDEPDKGTAICSFVRYAMREKGNVLGQIAHPCVEPMVKLHRFVMNERHYMMQFLRFREMQGGVWFAACNPKANVVPILMDWFSARFNTQPFIIFDEAHGIAGVSHNGAWTLEKATRSHCPRKPQTKRLWQMPGNASTTPYPSKTVTTPNCTVASCLNAFGVISPKCRNASPTTRCADSSSNSRH